MPPAPLGADADELQHAARTLKAVADELDGASDALTTTFRSVEWLGGVAHRFGSRWNGEHQPRLNRTARDVRDAAARLERNADEQRLASRGSPSGSGSPTGTDTSAGADSPDVVDRPTRPALLERLEAVLAGLGADHDAIVLIGDIAADLAGNGVTDDLIEILTDEAFVGLLDAAGHVLDAGQFVVDAVIDFAEQPELAFDERIVHALADGAVRLGLEQGMEAAAEFLAGAATTALLPGFGAVLAPIVGNIAGAIAGEVMDVVVVAVDGATDVVDDVADCVVEAYRDVMAAFGVLTDVAEAAMAVVDGAADLAVDGAEALADAGGAAIGGLADAGAAVVDIGGELAGSVGGLFGGDH